MRKHVAHRDGAPHAYLTETVTYGSGGACGNTSRTAKGAPHAYLTDGFSEYYNHWRRHSTIGGAVPSLIHRGEVWQRPDRSAKALPDAIERRFFPDTRVTAFRMAA